ncbi:signal peptidase I [Coprobacillus sp. CAG:605]|nr:signal peptidase I [Coprobacillus sp. CAG:605]
MKILRNIIRIFAAILLIANFILILSTRYEIFNVRTIKNTGDYMNPTIKDNDLVVSLKKSSYKKGEIILVKQTDEYYISRITNIDNYSVDTKDDNRTTKNSLKNINDIEGKVVLVINKEVMMLYIITIALVCLLLVSDMFITLSTSTETNPL